MRKLFQHVSRRNFSITRTRFHGAIKQQPQEAVDQLYVHTPGAEQDHHHHHGEHEHNHEAAPAPAVPSPATPAASMRKARTMRLKTNEEKIQILEPYFGFKLEPAQTYPKLDKEIIKKILNMDDQIAEKALFDLANLVTERFYNNQVFFRGIIEFSNVCQKNCNYCGIRKEMKGLHRYTMTREEIIETAVWAHESQIGSIMLQSGELVTDKRIEFLCNIIKEVKEKTGTGKDGLGISLSLGELSREHYAKLLEAGAHRYLLRIESSNPKLYSMLHPSDGNHVWETRRDCLLTLKDLGYQIGTGVMIQLPYQTIDDLASDILFFKQIGTDMIGMGPYIVQKDTPLGKIWMNQINGTDNTSSGDEPSIISQYVKKYQAGGASFDKALYNKHLFRLSLKMVAMSRIVNGPVNIAATTALQAIHPAGREISLNCGGNMVMPIITPTKYRADYQLYEGKPCIDDDREECRSCLTKRLKWAGKDLIKNKWGDPLTAKGRSKLYNE